MWLEPFSRSLVRCTQQMLMIGDVTDAAVRKSTNHYLWRVLCFVFLNQEFLCVAQGGLTALGLCSLLPSPPKELGQQTLIWLLGSFLATDYLTQTCQVSRLTVSWQGTDKQVKLYPQGGQDCSESDNRVNHETKGLVSSGKELSVHKKRETRVNCENTNHSAVSMTLETKYFT